MPYDDYVLCSHLVLSVHHTLSSILLCLQVLKAKEGEIVVARRPKTGGRNAEEYLPCEHCFGFFYVKMLWQHVKDCPLRVSTAPKGNSVRCGKVMLSRFLPTPEERTATEIQANKLFTHMKETHKNPGITKICREDALIREFAMSLLEKLGTKEEQRRKDQDNISTKVRTIGRLLKHLNEKRITLKKNPLTLSGYITGTNFKEVVSGVKCLAIETDSPSIATNLGHYIKHIALLKSSLAIEAGNKEWRTEKEEFMELYNAHWTSRVSCVAARRIKLRAMKKEKVLPMAEDLNLLNNYINKESKILCVYLNHQILKNRDHVNEEQMRSELPKIKSSWDRLAQFILVWLCMFNKRRISEIDEIEVTDIKNASKNDVGDQDIDQYLNVTERLLKKRYILFYLNLSVKSILLVVEYSYNCDVHFVSLRITRSIFFHICFCFRMSLCEVRGKSTRRLRKVFVLLKPEMMGAVRVLLAARELLGIPSSNKYLFARPNSDGPMDGCTAMRDVTGQCKVLKKPKAIRSRQLRTYLATTLQVY